VWWLVTWTTYASWLPGDPRGFRMWRGREYIPPPKRYAKPGEPTYRPAPYRERHTMYKATSGAPVRLASAEQALLLPAIVAEVDAIPLVAAIVSIDVQHVHLLAQFGTMPIRRIVGRLKAAATRAWREQGGDTSRLWSRNCDMKVEARSGVIAFGVQIRARPSRSRCARTHVGDPRRRPGRRMNT